MVASPDLYLFLLRDTTTGPPVAVKTPCITSAMGLQVCLSKRMKGHGRVSGYQRGEGAFQKDWSVWNWLGRHKEGQSLTVVGSVENES